MHLERVHESVAKEEFVDFYLKLRRLLPLFSVQFVKKHRGSAGYLSRFHSNLSLSKYQIDIKLFIQLFLI